MLMKMKSSGILHLYVDLDSTVMNFGYPVADVAHFEAHCHRKAVFGKRRCLRQRSSFSGQTYAQALLQKVFGARWRLLPYRGDLDRVHESDMLLRGASCVVSVAHATSPRGSRHVARGSRHVTPWLAPRILEFSSFSLVQMNKQRYKLHRRYFTPVACRSRFQIQIQIEIQIQI
jgi:hypothetical protein